MTARALHDPAPQLLLRLAGFLAQPFAQITPAAARALTEDLPALAQPLLTSDLGQRALTRHLHRGKRLRRAMPAPETRAALSASAEAQQALAMALAPLEQISGHCARLAAAIHGARIAQILLKPQRIQIQSLLGPRAYGLALREAPAFYPALKDLDGGADLLAEAPDLPAHPMGQRAAAALAAHLAHDLPLAGAVLALRLTGRAAGPLPLEPAHRHQIARCLRQKETP